MIKGTSTHAYSGAGLLNLCTGYILGLENSLLWEAVECTVGSLLASLISTSSCPPLNTQNISRCLPGVKLRNHDSGQSGPVEPEDL